MRCRAARGALARQVAGEAGSATVEAVLVVPVLMVVILAAVQLGLWALAQQAVQQAASRAAVAAAGLGASTTDGTEAGQQDLQTVAGRLVPTSTLTVRRVGTGTVVAVVTGTATSILPWFHPAVTAERRATVQRFRSGP